MDNFEKETDLLIAGKMSAKEFSRRNPYQGPLLPLILLILWMIICWPFSLFSK